MFFAVTFQLAQNVFGSVRVMHAIQVGAVLAFTASLLMITGPSLTGQRGLSHSHSHVFLTAQAATSHVHDGTDSVDSDVISLVSLAADSSFGAVHAPSAEPEQIAPLISFALEAHPARLYDDAVTQVLEEPPRSI